MTRRSISCGVGLILLLASVATAHDIPNQRVDRSIQVTLTPGRLAIDYEVSLTELTLTQDLRSLVGSRPGAERSEWLKLYGEVTGPLNAKGFLVSVDGQPVRLESTGYRLAIEEHPRYTFRLEAPVPASGRLKLRDANFASSEGTSRLAIRGRNGVTIAGDDGPTDVEQVPIRPVWQLSDAEERRTKQVEVAYRTLVVVKAPAVVVETTQSREAPPEPDQTVLPPPKTRVQALAELLDRGAGVSWAILAIVAAGLGAAHAIQPGHGKTLVTAAAIGPGARWYQPALLGLATTTAHVGSVLAIAAVLWATGSSRVESIHVGLARAAGFIIAAVGLWRLGRHLGGHGEHDAEHASGDITRRSALSLIVLGLAGGLVPCWDAVGLLVLAASLDRLAAGIGLVLAFSAGMAAVLVAVGGLAWRLRAAALERLTNPAWPRRLGIAAGVLLATAGLVLFLQ